MKSKENNKDKESFLEKLKDKKYKAKVELIAGFALIVILLIYSSISGVSNNYNYDYTNTIKENNNPTTEEEKFILDKITDNYSYNIDITLTKKEEDNTKTYNYSYNGKIYKNNTIINKVIDNNTHTYYKVDDIYYTKDNEEYIIDDINNIYDLLDYKYLNLEDVKKYIDIATLDHTTNYSNGNIVYNYNLNVSDIIKIYKGEEVSTIEINVIENIPTITIDYTNILKQTDESIEECKVIVKYTDIDTLEEFTIID